MPAEAVTCADSAAVTADTVAVKPALVAPAGTVTEEGTATAVLLLASATVSPPTVAGAFSVTVQLSVPAPVIRPLLQLNPLSTPGAAAAVPVPLSATVRVAVPAVTVMDPVCVPAAMGANCSWSVWLCPPAIETVPLFSPAREKYWPVTCGVASCTADEPLFVTDTVALAVCPTSTDPKATELDEITMEEEPLPLPLFAELDAAAAITLPHPDTPRESQEISTASSAS